MCDNRYHSVKLLLQRVFIEGKDRKEQTQLFYEIDIISPEQQIR